MTYVENIFVLLAAPLVACLLVVEGRARLAVSSIITGMLTCLISSYLSTFCAQWVGADAQVATVEVAPVVEEAVKLLPLLYYLLVLEPSMDEANQFVVFVAVGFATMESACYLAEYGTSSPMLLALRGLSASMMHLSCGVVVGYGLTQFWTHPWLKAGGTFGLLSMAIIYHGIYNVLVAWSGPAQVFAFLLPSLALAAVLVVRRAMSR